MLCLLGNLNKLEKFMVVIWVVGKVEQVKS